MPSQRRDDAEDGPGDGKREKMKKELQNRYLGRDARRNDDRPGLYGHDPDNARARDVEQNMRHVEVIFSHAFLPPAPACCCFLCFPLPLSAGFLLTTGHHLGKGGVPCPTHLPTPLKDWVTFSSGRSASQKFSLAPLAPIGLDHEVGGGLDPPIPPPPLSFPTPCPSPGGGGGGGPSLGQPKIFRCGSLCCCVGDFR